MNKKIGIVLLTVALGGCAAMPQSILYEAGHTSHASAGWPFGPCGEEAGYTAAGVMARWRKGPAYIDAGFMANLQGRDGGGFRGPAEIFQVRFGIEVKLND